MILETLTDAVGDLQARWTDLEDGLTELSTRITASPSPVAMTPPAATTVAALLAHASAGHANSQVSAASVTTAKAIATMLPQASIIFQQANADCSAVETTISTNVGPTGLDFLEPLFTWPDSLVSSSARLVRSRVDALRGLIDNTLQELVEITTPLGGLASLSGIRGSVDDISTYPVLTQGFEYGVGSGWGGGGDGPSGGNVRMVQSAIVQVLGRRPRTADVRSFVAALDRSFTCVEV